MVQECSAANVYTAAETELWHDYDDDDEDEDEARCDEIYRTASAAATVQHTDDAIDKCLYYPCTCSAT